MNNSLSAIIILVNYSKYKDNARNQTEKGKLFSSE